MTNILPREKRIQVLHHLVEGNTLRSTSRLTGVHRTTIQNLLVDFGTRCEQFQDRELRGLTLNHVECDEIWTFVGKKQSRLTVDEKAECHDIGDVYVFTAIDAETKLLPSYVVGKRSADSRPSHASSLSRAQNPSLRTEYATYPWQINSNARQLSSDFMAQARLATPALGQSSRKPTGDS